MSRSRTITVGLAAGALLAMSIAGCAKAVTGTPEAASTPTTTTPKSTGGGDSGGSGGTQSDRFCATLKPDLIQQAFGIGGAKIVPGQDQDNNGVLGVACDITAGSGASAIEVGVIAFNFAGVSGATTETVLQNAQTQLGKLGSATNFQPQVGVGDSDGAFSCDLTADGKPSIAVVAAKSSQGSIDATDIVATGAVQLQQVLAFAGLVDTD